LFFSVVKIHSTFWLFFALIISTAYRSKLVTSLLFPLEETIPTTFKELEASNYTIGLKYSKGTRYEFIKSSTNPVFMKIFKKMVLEPDNVKCFKRAIGTKFSCISWASMAEFVFHQNLSDQNGQVPLKIAPAMTYFQYVSMIFERRAGFRTNLDLVVGRAVNNGLIGKWKKLDFEIVRKQRLQWERKTNQTIQNYRKNKKSCLTLSHLSGSFLLVTAGTVSGFISFLIELIYWKSMN